MKKKAFTLVEVLIVVSILGLLAAVGIPAFLNSRQNASNNIKEMNVSAVNAAKDQWAIINNKAPNTTVDWADIKDYIGGGATEQSDLSIDGTAITINKIGVSAEY